MIGPAVVTADHVKALGDAVEAAVSRVVVGKQAQTRLLLVALLSEGHVLIDDVPGVAKTLLVKTAAAALDLSFSRVQCTPDLLPGDVTGSLVFDQGSGDFAFRRGPVFANLVLADEVNRATPRAQSSFLEAMEERQVTVEGEAHPLPRPFVVLATQNPVELKGTFPLPEAQLDRFLLRLRMGYPSEDEEVSMVERFREGSPLGQVEPAASAADVVRAIEVTKKVHVSADLERYIVALVRATRESDLIQLGASPRATLLLAHAAQASAALDGRDFVVPDDVHALIGSVLGHRLILAREARLERRDPEDVLATILKDVPVPVEGPPDERP